MNLNFLPILALHNILTMPRQRDRSTYYENCCTCNPCWHSHHIAPLSQQWDSQSAGRLQKTSLKVHDIRFFWKGTQGTPDELHFSLNELENEEYYRCCQRPEMFAEIKAARPLITKAAQTFNEIKAFEQILIKIRNKLRLQNATENVQQHLEIIKNLLAEIVKIKLPKDLTKTSVEVYAKKAKETLQDCESKLLQLEQKTTTELSSENEKTQTQAIEILCNKSPNQTIDENVELPTGPKESHDIAIQETVETVSETEIITETAIEREEAVETAIESEKIRAEPSNTSNESPEIISEAVAMPPAIDIIKNEILIALQRINLNFEKMIEELEHDFSEVKLDYCELFDIINEQIESLKESTDQITIIDQAETCLEKIKRQEATLQIISDLLKSEALNSKTHGESLAPVSFFAQLLMKKMAGFTLNSPLQATYDALNLFLDADKLCNFRAFKNTHENECFLRNHGFNNMAETYTNYIQKAKNADAIFSKGDDLETFERYCDEWDKACELMPFELNALTQLLNHLRTTEEKYEALIKASGAKTIEWTQNFQFVLKDQLDTLLENNSRNIRKAELTFNVNDIEAFISLSDGIVQEIIDLIKSEDMSLLEVIAYFENRNPEIAALVRKQCAFQLNTEILNFIDLVESSSVYSSSNEAVQKILNQAYSLLKDPEVSTGIFGMSKKRMPLDELSFEDLQKLAVEMKIKLEECEKEFQSL